jgi:hypothetical protein
MRPIHHAALVCAAILLCSAAPAGAQVVPPGQPGPDGVGPYADHVVSADQGRTVVGDPVDDSRSDPSVALGAPGPIRDAEGFPISDGIYALGYRGSIVLGFDNPICNGSGADFGLSVISDEAIAPQERADVFVSNDRSTWTKVADDIDRNANVALPPSIAVARFVRIVDVSGDGPDQSADGYDVDAARALNTLCENSPTADLALFGEGSFGGEALPGTKELVWTIRNDGSDPSPKQRLTVAFTSIVGPNPAGVRPADEPQPGWASGCTATTRGSAEPAVWTCDTTDLDPGEMRQVRFQIPRDFAYSVRVDGEVTSLGAADVNSDNDRSSGIVTFVVREADLQTTIVEGLAPSEPSTYDDEATVRVTNAGPESLGFPTVVFRLPETQLAPLGVLDVVEGCDDVEAFPSRLDTDPGSGGGLIYPNAVRCRVPPLAVGASRTVRIRVHDPEVHPGRTVTVTADEDRAVNDPVRRNNTVTMTYEVLPRFDLNATVTAPASVPVATVWNPDPKYDVTASSHNFGPTAVDASIEVRFSGIGVATTTIARPPNCGPPFTIPGTNTRVYSCKLGLIAPGSTKSATFSATSNFPLVTYTVQAIARPFEGDTNTANNTSAQKAVTANR